MFQSKPFNINSTNPINNICNPMQDSQDDVLSEMSHSLTQHSHQHKEQKQRQDAFKIKSEMNSNKTKLNKLKRINKKQQYVTSGSLHKNAFDMENDLNLAGKKHQRHHKLPLLTCIELVKNGQKFAGKYEEKSDESEHEEEAEAVNMANDIDDECDEDQEIDKDKKQKRNILFKDYVLIPSQTKYKHLLRTVFEQTRLNSKQNYDILTGYIKIHNWKPIRLENISSTPQSPLNFHKSTHQRTQNVNKNNSLNSSLNSNGHLNKNWTRSNESVNSETYSRSSSPSASPVYSSSSIESPSLMSPNSIVTNEIDEKRQEFQLDYASGVTRNDNKHRSSRHTNKSTTVYDMLSHVASFSVLHIKLALKNSKAVGEQSKSYEDVEEDEEVEEEQEQNEQQKENHYDASNVETKDSLPTKLSDTLLNNQSSNLMMQSLLLQVLQQKQSNNGNNTNSVSPKSIADLLSSNSNTMTSLYSNQQQQLASLLPFLNLPILSQMLNNLNNSANLSQESTSAALNFNNKNSQTNSPNTNNKQLTNNDFARKNSSSSLSSFIQSNQSQPNFQKHLQQQQQQQQQALANLLYNNGNHINEDILSINTSQISSNGNSNNRLLNNSNQVSSLIEASPSPSLSTTSTSSSLNSLHQNQNKSRSAHNKSSNNEQVNIHQSKQSSNHPISLSTNDMISKYASNNGLNGNRRQRERTTFDPQEEITRLMQIFEKTHHPTRYQIAAICESLNSLACRKDKKPLEPYNIQYWFKNARAALRRKVKNESKEDGLLDCLNNKTSLSKVNNHDENSKCSNYEDEDEEYLDNTMDENDEQNNFDIKAILSQPVQSNSTQNKTSMFNLNEKDKASRGNNKNYQLSNSNSNRSRSSSVNNDLESLNDEEECNGVKNEDIEDPYDSAYTKNASRPSSSYTKLNSNKQVNTNFSNANGKIKGSSSKRNRVFIDPISEVPILEHYFSIETYPDHYLIEKICDNLNKGEYRYKFPKLESRNIQLWFKNHRAKLKRLKSSNNTNENDNGHSNAKNPMQQIDNYNDDYSLNDDDLSRNHNQNNNNNDQQEQQDEDDYENFAHGNYDEEADDFDDAYDNQDDNKYSNHQQQRTLNCESGN